jgi:hypothetical protein
MNKHTLNLYGQGNQQSNSTQTKPCDNHKEITQDIEQLHNLYTQIRKEFKKGGDKFLYALTQNTKELENLRKDLDERKLINNFNEKEKEWLKCRVEKIGERSEEEDKTLAGRVLSLEKAVVAIAKNDENQDKSIGKLEKLLYVAIGIIVTFFVTFGYKTLFLGI